VNYTFFTDSSNWSIHQYIYINFLSLFSHCWYYY